MASVEVFLTICDDDISGLNSVSSVEFRSLLSSFLVMSKSVKVISYDVCCLFVVVACCFCCLGF